MLIIAGGIVLGWLAIAAIRAVSSSLAGPTPEELREMSRRLDDFPKD